MAGVVRTIAYVRPHSTSTPEETRRRAQALREVCAEVRVESSSDPRAARTELSAVMEDLYHAAGDSELVLLFVDDLADLGRSMPHVLTHLRQLIGLGHVLILTQAPTWRGLWDPRHARIPEDLALPDMLDTAALVTELDKARGTMASERVRRGQARARDAGTAFGRPPALDADQRSDVVHLLHEGEDPEVVAAEYGVSRATVMRVWRARTPHATGENTTRGKATHEPAPEAHQQ